MKKHPSASFCRHWLVAVACFLSVYHTLYTLLTRQIVIPQIFQLAEYGLVLLLGISLLLTVCTLWREGGNRAVLSAAARYKNRCFLLPAIFFLLLFVSALLLEGKQPGSFRFNLGCLYDAAISLFVLFPLSYHFGFRHDDRLLKALAGILTTVYLFIVLMALYGISFDRELLIAGAPIQMEKGRLWLGRSNPNTTGMFCAVLLMLGLWRIASGGRTARVLYTISSAAFYVCLILTDSRSSLLASSVCLGFYAGIMFQRKHCCGRRGIRQSLLSCAVGGLALLLFWLGRYLVALLSPVLAVGLLPAVAFLFHRCCGRKQSPLFWSVAALAAAAAILAVFLSAPDFLPDFAGFSVRKLLDNGGSGRIRLWKGLWGALGAHPEYLLHGCGPYSITELVEPFFGRPVYTHNQFLEILTGYGLPALILFLFWLMAVAQRCRQTSLDSLREGNVELAILPLVLLLLLINNMFEATLLFYRYVTGCIFFLTAGHVCAHRPPPYSVPSADKNPMSTPAAAPFPDGDAAQPL